MSSLRTHPAASGLRPGIALVLLTVLVSGVSNFVNFKAVQGTNVDAWIAVRNVAVAGMLLPFALLLRRGARSSPSRGDWVRLATIGLVGGAVPFFLYFHGFQMAAQQGGAASASLGYRSLFLVASVLGVLALRERLPRRFVLGAALVFGGNLLLLGLTGPVWTDGTGFVLLATALWAVEYTLSKHTLRSLPSHTVALGRMGFGAAFLLLYLGITGQGGAVLGFESADWLNLGLSALLLFAFVSTWYAGLKTVDLSTATSLLVVAFPITWAFGVAVGGTTLALTQTVGAALVVIGAGAILGVSVFRGLWSSLVRYVRSQGTGSE